MEKFILLGVYPTRDAAQSAIENFRIQGFNETDLTMLISHPKENSEKVEQERENAYEGAFSGALTGTAVGGLFASLASLGTIAVLSGPTLGYSLLALPAVGMGIGGISGTVAGILSSIGIPEYEAREYEETILSNGVLLSVAAANETQLQIAKEIMEKTGGEHISKKTVEES